MMRVKLSAILDGMEMQFDEMRALLDRATGEVVSLSDEAFRAAEDDADLADVPEWQRKSTERTKAVEAIAAGRFVELPDRFDIDE